MQARTVERDGLMRFKDFQGRWRRCQVCQENKQNDLSFYSDLEKNSLDMWLL